MHCPHCNTELPDDARFCIECGTAVRIATGETVPLSSRGNTTITCPHCRSINPRYARFCVHCGQSLLTSGPMVHTPPSPQPRPTYQVSHWNVALFLIGATLLIPVIFSFPPMIWLTILIIIGIAQMIFYSSIGKIRIAILYAIGLLGIGLLLRIRQLTFPALILLVGLALLIGIRLWKGK